MGTLRSWLGSILCLLVFFLARRFAAGIAGPLFVTIIIACAYIWTCVLRVPELKGIEPAEDEQPLSRSSVPGGSAASSAPPAAAATASTTEVPAATTDEKDASIDSADADAEACAAAPPKAETPVSAVVAEEAEAASPPAAHDNAVTADSTATDAVASSGAAPENEDSNAQTPSLANASAAASAEGTSVAREEAGAETAAVPNASTTLDDSDLSDDEQDREPDDEHADPEKAQELRLQGNEHFKASRLHDAREAYSEALYLTPSADKKEKAVLYSNRAACLQKLSRWEDVIDDCRKAIECDPTYAKAYHRRSAAYEATNKWHDANEDLKKVIELDPTMRAKEYKHQAVLEKRAQEQFETDKEEMMGKLKDMGNMVLGKFGMSTDNFKCEKDPNTGSYSIKFQQ